MKLKRSSKKKKIVIVAIVAVVVLALICVVGVALSNAGFSIIPQTTTTTTTVIYGINMSVYPRTTYYVGEEFDPGNMSVQLVSNNNGVTRFIKYSSLEISGFDSSEPCEKQWITVKYKDYITGFNVKIIEPESEDEVVFTGIKLTDNVQTSYTLEEWNANQGPYLRGVNVIFVFSDGSEIESTLNVYDLLCDYEKHLDEPGETTFTIRLTRAEGNYETIVKVTITK